MNKLWTGSSEIPLIDQSNPVFPKYAQNCYCLSQSAVRGVSPKTAEAKSLRDFLKHREAETEVLELEAGILMNPPGDSSQRKERIFFWEFLSCFFIPNPALLKRIMAYAGL